MKTALGLCENKPRHSSPEACENRPERDLLRQAALHQSSGPNRGQAQPGIEMVGHRTFLGSHTLCSCKA